MPMSRSRGGSRMPCAGDDTTRPAMLMVPADRELLAQISDVKRRRHGFTLASRAPRSLAIAEGLVPFRDPRSVQLHVLIEVREPDLNHLGIEAFRIDRRYLERGEIAQLLDHEGLALD